MSNRRRSRLARLKARVTTVAMLVCGLVIIAAIAPRRADFRARRAAVVLDHRPGTRRRQGGL
jgi:hypothetical protein